MPVCWVFETANPLAKYVINGYVDNCSPGEGAGASALVPRLPRDYDRDRADPMTVRTCGSGDAHLRQGGSDRHFDPEPS